MYIRNIVQTNTWPENDIKYSKLVVHIIILFTSVVYVHVTYHTSQKSSQQ